MKKLLKTIFVSLIAAGMLCTAAFAEEAAEKKEVRVLCLGNSILNHGEAPHLGWYGSWGMAASSADKDYYHVLMKNVTEANPDLNVVFDKMGASALETCIVESVTEDYTAKLDSVLKGKLTSFKPDIIIMQIAENAHNLTADAVENAFTQYGKYCTQLLPDVTVLYCTPPLGPTANAAGIRVSAEKNGYPLAELIKYNKPEYKAAGLFEHAGVAGHPSDKGMEAIGLDLAKNVNYIISKRLNPSQISVKVDSVYVDCAQYGVLPQIINGRTMVPLRSIFEALGAEVVWDDATKTATSYLGGVEVKVTIGADKLIKDGEEKPLDVPAQIIDSRTLVPVRAISEAYNCEVKWDDATKTASIKMPEKEFANIKKIENDPCDILGKSGLYSMGQSVVEIVKDPDDENNNVIKVKSNATGKSYAYVWSNMQFVAGVTYKVAFDGRFISGYNGEEAEKGYIGICFHTGGKDKGVGGITVYKDKWSHCEMYYTIPEDYKYIPDGDRFGLYGEPINEKSAVFLVDNLTVLPVNEEEIVNQKKLTEEEKLAMLKSLKSVYKIQYNNADSFLTENVENAVFGENSVTGKSATNDAKFTFKNDIKVNIDNVKGIKFTAKIPKGLNTEIFFATDAAPVLSESKKFMVTSETDELTTVYIETGKNVEWAGTLKTIRFDPVTKSGNEFEVVSLELLAE